MILCGQLKRNRFADRVLDGHIGGRLVPILRISNRQDSKKKKKFSFLGALGVLAVRFLLILGKLPIARVQMTERLR